MLTFVSVSSESNFILRVLFTMYTSSFEDAVFVLRFKLTVVFSSGLSVRAVYSGFKKL
jgi:hypothetical protein